MSMSFESYEKYLDFCKKNKIDPTCLRCTQIGEEFVCLDIDCPEQFAQGTFNISSKGLKL